MVRNAQLSFDDVQRILRRYWWILPITTVLLGVVAVVASYVLTKKYVSQTMVLVEQPTVSPELVKPVITEDLNHRLSSMQEQILSRTRLQPIIEKFGLYASDRGTTHIEDLVDRLRTAVKITPLEPMAGTQNRQLPGFYINVTFNDARLAQQICTEITSMFLEQNARERKQQSKETTDFFQQRLDEAKNKLDEQDAKLAQFKRQYLGSLPEEEQTNLSLLMGTNTQLEANTQAISRAQQDKTFTESLLAQQEANLKAQTNGGANPESLDQQLSAMQDNLLALQAKYTPEHPDVVKAQRAIDELKKRIEAQQKAPPSPDGATHVNTFESPQIQQLRAKLRQDDLNIADLTKRQAQIQNETRVLQARVQASPVVEQQFKEMTRNYQTASENYNDLLKKHNTSELAGVLESQQESEQFKVFDPPSLPNQPSFPNKILFASGGFGGGFVVGLGILYLLAAGDKSLHTERDIELALKLPVLATVPTLQVLGNRAALAPGILDTDRQHEPTHARA
jgi:polysaccharide chain length determinant protein (PEP-CTERM system associated)